MNQIQIEAVREIERQLQIIWAAELPPTPPGPPVIAYDGLQDVQSVINSAPDGAIVDLNNLTAITGSVAINKPLTLRNGTLTATPNVNDLVNITGSQVSLLNLRITGDGTTKRGVAANGTDMLLDGVEIRNIRRLAQETQALAIWNGTNLTVRNSILEGASQSFLSGGSSPTVPNHVPANLVFDNVLFTRPLEWRGQGYAAKTIFELKSARNVQVINSTIENMWSGEGQTGFAFTFTPSQYGNSPETVVENVLIENNTIQNVSSGANILGFTQHNELERQTLQLNNISFLNNHFTLNRTLMGGHGTLMQLGREPMLLSWRGNTVTTDGDAFLRVTDSRIVPVFDFSNNIVNRCGTYGIFSPLGSRGIGWSTQFPAGIMSGNTFHLAHSTFRTNFPNNSYILA